MLKTDIRYSESMPQLPDQSIIVFDQVLLKQAHIKKWLKKYPRTYKVKAGEGLKKIDSLPRHLKNISELSKDLGTKEIHIVALGGGSVGDFCGFVASIYKRGVKLTQIPSTWLAAIDSSHGGKNALNVGGFKNQVGTIYPAASVFLVKELLLSQPEARVRESLGEVYKIALLQGGSLWKKVAQEKFWDGQILWQFLPALIEAKYKIVRKDLFEKTGYRHILNLGHTVGHVIEAQQNIPHGLAVLYGLHFSLWQSDSDILLPYFTEAKLALKKIKSAEKYLIQDKKKLKNKIRFILLKKPGKPIIKEYSAKEIARSIQEFSK